MLRPGAGAFSGVSLERAQDEWQRRVGPFGVDRFVLSGHLVQLVTDIERAGSPELGLKLFRHAKARPSTFFNVVHGVENTLFLAFALNLDWPDRLGPDAFCTLAGQLIAPEILGGEHLYRMLHVALPGSTLRLGNGSYALRREVEVTERLSLEGALSTEVLLEHNLIFLVGTRIRNILFLNQTARSLELQLNGVGWKEDFRLANVACCGVGLRAQYCGLVHLSRLSVCDALIGLRVFHARQLVVDGDAAFKSLIHRCQRAFYIAETETARLSDTVVQFAEEVLDVHVRTGFEARRCTFKLSMHLGEAVMPEGRLPTFVDTAIVVENDSLDLGTVEGGRRTLCGMNTAGRFPFQDEAMRRAFATMGDTGLLRPGRAAELQERLARASEAAMLDTTGGRRVPKTSLIQRPPDVDYYYRALEDGPAQRLPALEWYLRQARAADKMLLHVQAPPEGLEGRLLAHEKECLSDRVHAWRLGGGTVEAAQDRAGVLAWAFDKERESLHAECLKLARASLDNGNIGRNDGTK